MTGNMNSIAKYKAAMIVGAALNTLPRLIDFGTGAIMVGQKYSDAGRWWYYTGQAASFLFILLAQRHTRCITTYSIVIMLAISNLADEMFFDPTKLGFNELVFALFVPSYYIYEHRRKGNIQRGNKRH